MTFFLNYTTVWERFLEWYRGSWMDRFFAFLFERVFVVAFAEYPKIPLSPNAGAVARNLILSFLVAFWIAAVTMAYIKSVPGGFIRRLLALGAVDEEHAVTLAEAGYRRSAAVRRDLARGGALAKLLCRVGDGKHTVAGAAVPPAKNGSAKAVSSSEKDVPVQSECPVEKDNAAPADPKDLEPAQPAAQPAAAVPPAKNGSAKTASSTEKADPVQSESPVEENNAVPTEPKDLAPALPAAQPAAAVPPAENGSAEATSTSEKDVPVQSESPVEKDNAAPAEPKDLEPAQPDRFYIPENLRIRAELRFARRGSGVLSVVLSVVLSTFAAFLLCNLLPSLFTLANWILGG